MEFAPCWTLGLDYGMFGHVDAGVLRAPGAGLTIPEQEVLLRRISDQVVALTAKYGNLMARGARQGFSLRIQPRLLRRAVGRAATGQGRSIRPTASAWADLHALWQRRFELVSVDGPKRGKFDRQIPIAVREKLYTGAGLQRQRSVSPSRPTPHVPLGQDQPRPPSLPKGRAGLMREWLRQLSEQGFDPLAEEVALQSGVYASNRSSTSSVIRWPAPGASMTSPTR